VAETHNREWKESWRDEYLKTVCAFANSNGGVLDIGRDDNGTIIGAKDAEKLLEDLPNKMWDMLGVIGRVELLSEGGTEFVRISIEAYPNPISLRGKYYIRSGSTTQILNGSTLNRFLLDRAGERWDSVPIPGIAVKDLDSSTIDQFRKRAEKSKRLNRESLKDNNADLMEKLRLTDGEALKRAAILLFHPEPDRWVSGAFVKIGYFRDNATLLYQDEIKGNLFQQLERTMDLLLTKYTKALISYDGLQRVESYPVPVEALREILLNAIAHKDYASCVPVQISVYENKIQFWNNGQLPENWTVDQLLSKHSSQPYNPDIANTLFRAGLIEAWGRGIEGVLKKCREKGDVKPELVFDKNGLWVNFHLDHSLWGQSGDQSGDQSATEHQILSAISNKELSTTKIAEAIGMQSRTGSFRRTLKELLLSGYIEQTIPEKPNSRLQKYRITGIGRDVLKGRGK
jgi:ATP-dependent DNA helicase RecG